MLQDTQIYVYSENEQNVVHIDSLPPLVVDAPQTSLKKLYSMRFVAFREYKIAEYKYNLDVIFLCNVIFYKTLMGSVLQIAMRFF